MFPLRAGEQYGTSILSPHISSWPSLVFPLASESLIAAVAGIGPSRSTEGKGSTFPKVWPPEHPATATTCGYLAHTRLESFSGPPLALNARWYSITRAGRGFRDAGGGT